MGATILTIIISLSLLCFSFGAVAVIYMVKFDKVREDLEKSRQNERTAIDKASRVTITLLDKDPIIESLRKAPHHLSDAEWEKVEATVNKVYDGFCEKLLGEGLTQGNIKVAVLDKLKFTTGEASVVLGISPASFTKAKQRLRDRLGL